MSAELAPYACWLNESLLSNKNIETFYHETEIMKTANNVLFYLLRNILHKKLGETEESFENIQLCNILYIIYIIQAI